MCRRAANRLAGLARGRVTGSARQRLRLKADLHAHVGDDPCDDIAYSAEMLIDAVSKLKYDVLAITCHAQVVHTERLAAYALRRGVLLIPAIEVWIEGKHVVILNPDEEQARASTFEELRKLGPRDAVVLAPHPFYGRHSCLGHSLIANHDVFDAVEYCCLYTRWLNLNRRAERVAKAYGKPMVGTSDVHTFPFSDSTFTWIEAEERTVPAVIEAIRNGQVRVETSPKPWGPMVGMVHFAARESIREILGLRQSGRSGLYDRPNCHTGRQ